jgi:thiol-disulfide isomerase/thioredoxin
MKKILAAILFAALLVGCQAAQTAAPTNTVPGALKPLGDMPKFELDNVAGGKFNSDELKGKVVVVDFWATWCQPCIIEIPNYNKIKEEYAGKDVEILGVTLESGSLEDAKPKVEEFDMHYPVVMGNDDVVDGFGGLIGFPTTFLVGKDGKIYKKYLGLTAKKKETIEKDIQTLLEPAE